MKQNYKVEATAEELLAQAREITGIELIDDQAVEPLTVLLKSMNEEGALDKQGAADIQKFIMRSLVNRLRMLRDFANHPEINDEVIKAPVFVCGSTRTGSTKTQKLLAASSDFNWLPFWQSLNPSLVTGDRDESPDARIKDADEIVAWFDEVSPNMKLTHALQTYEPEEESFILAHSLSTPVITGMVEAPSFIQWLMTRDITPQFEFLKNTLKYLQWQGYADPNKRWLLKSPFYAGLEPVLLKVFPDAQLVMTHRDPKQTMPSTCSLFTSYRKPYSDVKINAEAVVAGSSFPMNLHLQVREQHPEIKFCDIHYREVTKSVSNVAEKIYAFIGETLTDQARQRILDWDAKNPKHVKGVHRYTLEEFGLTEEFVAQAYANYLAFLDKTFPESNG